MRFKHFLNHGLKFAALSSTAYLGITGSKEFSYSLGLPGKSKNNYIDLRGEKRFDSYTLNDALENLTSNKYVGHVMFTVEQLAIIDKDSRLKTLKEKIDEQIIENNKSYHRHPSDFVHGLLSSHVYEDSTQNAVVKFKAKEKHEKYGKYLEGWVVYKVVSDGNRGYYGAIYINESEKQMVLAHRGTTNELMDLIRSESPWKTNFEGIIGGKIVPQQAKAFEIAKLAAKYAQDNGYNLSITGHSLGAWLAEQSVYFCYNDYGNIKAITFDSPGSGETYNSFKSSVKNPKSKVDTINFDIVTYVSKPNFVNSCNTHVARMYELPTEIRVLPENINKILSKLPKHIKENEFFLHGLLSITGHKLDLMLETFNPETGKPKICKEVLNWPHIKYISKDQSPLDFVRKQLDNQGLVGKVAGKFLIDAVELTTFGSLIRVAGDILSGCTNQKQYWKFFELANKGQNVLDEAGFALGYEAGYQVEFLNPRKDILNTGNIGSADWYLSQLDQCTHARLDKIKSDIVRKQLKEIKDLYKIEIDHRGKVVVESRSSAVSPDQIREWLMNLLSATKSEGDFSINNILKNYHELEEHSVFTKNDVPSLAHVGTVHEYSLPKTEINHFIGRTEIQKEIKKYLKNKECYVVVVASGGTGKTSTALEYGNQELKSGKNVKWIDADSPDKIRMAYEEINKQDLSKINLLIFDNVEKYDDIKDYLPKFTGNVEVLITSRHGGSFHNAKVIELERFTKKEAKQYLVTNLGNSRATDKELEEVIEKVGLLPYDLNQYCAPLVASKFLSVSKRTKEYQSGYASFDRLSKEACEVLKYASRLDPDFISIDLIKQLVPFDDSKLDEIEKELTSQFGGGALAVVYKEQNPGLKLHRHIQEDMLAFLTTKGESIKEIDDKLLVTLNALWNEKDKQTGKLLHFQASKALDNTKSNGSSLIDEQEGICGKLALYYKDVESNISIAEKYKEEQFALGSKKYHGLALAIYFNDECGNFYSGNDKLKALHYYEKALKISTDLGKPYLAALHNAGSSYEKICDKAKALELYKQAYIIDPVQTESFLKSVNSSFIDFIKVSELRNPITFRGELSSAEALLAIKMKIQYEVLNKIHDNVFGKSYWSYWSYDDIFSRGVYDAGVKGYLENYYLRDKLGFNVFPLNIERTLAEIGVGQLGRWSASEIGRGLVGGLVGGGLAGGGLGGVVGLVAGRLGGVLGGVVGLVAGRLVGERAGGDGGGVGGAAAGLLMGSILLGERRPEHIRGIEGVLFEGIGIGLMGGLLTGGLTMGVLVGGWVLIALPLKVYRLYQNENYFVDLLKFQNEQVEMAKMLCFEAINLGIMKTSKKDLGCAREFAKAYPKLTKKIAKEHPEYFVDALILKALMNPDEVDEPLRKYFDGKGVLDHEEEMHRYQYSNEVMDQLLKLRLESAKVEGVKTISPNYIWDGSVAIAERLINEILIASINNKKMFITLNLYGKHWVGLDILKTEDKIEISYMDSEQNEVPILLKEQLIKTLETFYPKHHVTLNEVALELQKYNNCELEAIESLALQPTGNRLEQEDPVIDSISLQNMLLGEQIYEICA